MLVNQKNYGMTLVHSWLVRFVYVTKISRLQLFWFWEDIIEIKSNRNSSLLTINIFDTFGTCFNLICNHSCVKCKDIFLFFNNNVSFLKCSLKCFTNEQNFDRIVIFISWRFVWYFLPYCSTVLIFLYLGNLHKNRNMQMVCYLWMSKKLRTWRWS